MCTSRADYDDAMLASFHGGLKFIEINFRSAAELAAVGGEDRIDPHNEGFLERLYTVVERGAVVVHEVLFYGTKSKEACDTETR